MKTILLVAAGTGGHVFPALALAKALQDLGMNPIFAGRRASMEQELVSGQGYNFFPLSSSGFFGKGLRGKLLFAVNAAKGMAQVGQIMKREQPAAVVAAGGFGSVAPLTNAWLTRRPYFLLEQNCIPGRVTRYFCRAAREVYLTFATVKPLPARTVVTGTPLRRAMLDTPRHDDGRTVLVLGGSLGARALNHAVLDLAPALPELRFVVQTGRRDYAEIQQLVRERAVRNVELFDFTLAMQDYYARATLILSRAGGMVINEILAFGIPSILVPFPFATDNHQHANAQHIAQQGAALQIDQTRLPELKNIMKQLFEHPEQLAQMSENARRIAKRDAAETIAGRIRAAVGEGDADVR